MDDILVELVLPVSLAFIMLTLGLGLKWSDFGNVAKYPRAFILGLFNQMVLLPIVAFSLVLVFELPSVMSVGIMLLAFAPGGVTTNVLAKLGGGNVALSVSLTAVVTLLSVITVPVLLSFCIGYFSGFNADQFSILDTAISLFVITVVPVLLGMIINQFVPAIQDKLGRVLSFIAILLFAIIILGALAANWTVFIENLPIIGPILVLMNVIMLALGLYKAKAFGLKGQDGTTIAVETGVQNGTLAIAVAGLAFGTTGISGVAVPAAVYAIVMYLVTIPFVIWRKTRERSTV